MFRFITVVVLMSTMVLAKTASAEMKSLRSIIETDPSEDTYLYVSYRCSALNWGWVGLLDNIRNNKEAELEKIKAEKKARDFSIQSLMFIAKNKLDIKQDQVQENIQNIYDAYDRRWKNNFTNTGVNTGEMTLDDTSVCGELYTPLIDD